MQACELSSTRGAVIAARFYTPPGRPQAAVVIGGAMGVKQDYYAAFAQWLADQGYLVASFDYRGMGDSQRGPLRELHADLFDWTDDFDAVIAEALRRSGQAPLYLIGHSLGAQLPGLLKHRDRIAGLVSVAAGSGYWRDNAPQLKRMVLYFWHVLVPVATALFGYFPGRKLRKVPADMQAKRIGHFGFFRAQFQSSLWARTLMLLQGFQVAKETAA